jgi:hypothetical protein
MGNDSTLGASVLRAAMVAVLSVAMVMIVAPGA